MSEVASLSLFGSNGSPSADSFVVVLIVFCFLSIKTTIIISPVKMFKKIISA